MNTNCGKRSLLVAVLAVVPTMPAWAGTPYQIEWARQRGTSVTEWGSSVAVDSAGNAFLTGYTHGSLGGSNVGATDAYLIKYSSAGALLWIRQLGTVSADHGREVTVDSAGNAYITGYTYGSLGGTYNGAADVFIAKYSAAGGLIWKRQIGTSSYDYADSIAVDAAGNAFICGETTGSLGGPNAGGNDAFIAKYSTAGALQWTRQIGTSSMDLALSVAIDSAGNAFITGPTGGNIGGPNAGDGDAFIAKYSTAGALQWTRQMGTSADEWGFGIAIDGADSIFISGHTEGSLDGQNAGESDAFVAKFSAAGDFQWARQTGTPVNDSAFSVSVDSTGSAFICGGTMGSLAGPNAGMGDAFIAKCSNTGTWLWTRQIGTNQGDQALSVAVDDMDSVFMAGRTTGNLGAIHTGFGDDAFIVKLTSGCPMDVSGNGSVDFDDVQAVMTQWGATSNTPADVNRDNIVDLADLRRVFAAWGACE